MHYSRTSKLNLGTQSLAVQGSLPAWLTGTVSREIAETTATLHTFALRGGRVTYAQRPAFPALPDFFADPARAHFRTLISPFAHTPAAHTHSAQARAAAELQAYAEQPLAVELDASTLGRLGVHAPAAPRHAPGSLYAQARVASGDVAVYQARARGIDTLGCLPAPALPYIHSVCSTRRYLVLTLTPLVYAERSRDAAPTLFDHFSWSPELGAQFVLLERATGKVAGRWEADAFFTLHHFHAFERGDEVFVDLVAYADARILQGGGCPLQPGTLRRYRLLPGARRATYETHSPVSIELPRAAARGVEGEQRWVYGVSLRDQQPGHAYDQLVRIDLHSGRDRIWTAAGCTPGEPVFVRRPGARSDEDGVVLSVVGDAGSRGAFLIVLDAASFAEIGRAGMAQRLPPQPDYHTSYALVY